MTVYAEVNGTTLVKFPYTLGSLMEDNPYTNYGPAPDLEVIFPQTNTAIQNGYTLVPVTYFPEPAFDPATQNCVQNVHPTLIDGVWTVSWSVTEKTPAEQQAYQQQVQDQNKVKASSLLAATDWTQAADVTNPTITPHLLNLSDFNAYRVSLRGIAINPPTTLVTEWPVIPDEKWS